MKLTMMDRSTYFKALLLLIKRDNIVTSEDVYYVPSSCYYFLEYYNTIYTRLKKAKQFVI